MKNVQGPKRKLSMTNPQFDFQKESTWKEDGKSQQVRGSSYVQYYPFKPIDEQPNVVDFHLKDQQNCWAFGPNTCFKIKGQFQGMTPAKGSDPEIPWAPLDASECDKVIVAPNWLDTMIAKIDFFVGNPCVEFSKQPKYMAGFINSWKYNYMDKLQKKKLCPQDASPGNGVPSKSGSAGWSMEEGSEWRKYGPKIFVSTKEITIDWIPLDLPPFFQGTNYLEETPRVCPIDTIYDIIFRIRFHEKLDSIFKNKPGNDKKYRFIFTDMYFVAETLNVLQSIKKSLLDKGELRYPGVTRLENLIVISAHSTTHKAILPNVFFPEGMFIFAVPKDVYDGKYTYSQNTDGNVFLQHNISQVNFKYGNQTFFLDSPNIGTINDDIIDRKIYTDYLTAGSAPFGLNVDPNKIKWDDVKNGFQNTPYPHVYINMCNYADKSRIIPMLSDGSMLKNRFDLEVTLTFNGQGSPKDAIFICCLYYTDCNMIYKQGRLSSPYVYTTT